MYVPLPHKTLGRIFYLGRPTAPTLGEHGTLTARFAWRTEWGDFPTWKGDPPSGSTTKGREGVHAARKRGRRHPVVRGPDTAPSSGQSYVLRSQEAQHSEPCLRPPAHSKCSFSLLSALSWSNYCPVHPPESSGLDHCGPKHLILPEKASARLAG